MRIPVAVCFLLGFLFSGVLSNCGFIGLQKCTCKYPSTKRYEILCMNAGLKSLPPKVNHTLSEGEAVGNFSHNSISNIPDFYFVFMRHFDSLDFSYNSIKSLNPNTLNGLETRLHTLLLKDNEIDNVAPLTFKAYTRLNILDLGGNKVKSPCGINLADIVTCSFADNGITSLNDQCFPDAQEVKQLDLSNNAISKIHESAFQGMSKLQHLNLNGNSLSDISNGFQSLAEIEGFESLSIRGNGITDLEPYCKYFWKNMKVLDFGYNKLMSTRPYCFSTYSKKNGEEQVPLELNFEHNQITRINWAAFKGLEDKLSILRANNNKISSIGRTTFTGQAKLSIVYLNNNQISDLGFLKEWNGNLLTELYLDNNELSELPVGIFSKLLLLTKLSLNGNKLVSLEANTFIGMPSILDLSLNNNLLTNLQTRAFSGINQLKRLKLNQNSLVTLKNCTFSNLDSLIEFHFADNLLHCDCDLLWLLEYMAKINVRGVPDKTVVQPVIDDYCHYPNSSRDLSLGNAVSSQCSPSSKAMGCFDLNLNISEVVNEQANITWRWSQDVSGIQNLVLTQLNVETNKVLHEEELGGQETLVKLEFISGDVYKVCITGTAGAVTQSDCTIWPLKIVKPTPEPPTTVAVPARRMHPGSAAAVAMAVILIIIIILIVLFTVYLWKTKKYRDLLPNKYSANSDESSPSSIHVTPNGTNGKEDPLDFRPAENQPMIAKPQYTEHDL